ncbi:MAG TPA: class I SAM-dependent methyltransferase [Thermoanaerobaculia bacterium]|nr:class I SAM-dependent methyltransferase [Thermoanaerobaculia bacterium]
MRVATGVGLPTEWIAAMTGRAFNPRRVLVAGCGIGVEAFALAERYPEAHVVGVDFSPRAIAEARRLQRKAGARKRVRFEVADLAARGLEKIAGEDFDVVSCHGVLSYVPDTAGALRNMARCMSADGVLLLGVNGAGHLSVRYRVILREFGYDVDQFRESEDVRELLRVCDALSIYPPVRIADFDAGYLAGDIFGPLNIALTVGGWNELLEKAGLHLASTFRAFYATRELVNRGLHAVLLPRTRAEVAGIVDVLHPSSFHQLLVTRDAPPAPPFARPGRLLKRKPAVTELYKIRKPRKGRHWNDLRDVALRSASTNTSADLTIPEWEVEILRKADGSVTLGSILGEVKPAVPRAELGEALYLLYLLGVLNP